MSDSKYIYCIIEAKERCEFGNIGLGEMPVCTIGLDGLACVVSDSDLDVYIANAVNIGEYERVLENVAREYTVLPMRFGTVASNEREILRMLKRHRNQFTKLLKRLTGKVEVEIEVFWKDMKAVFAEIVERNPALKKLKADPHAKLREDVIMAGQMVYQLLQEKKKRETEGFVKVLKKFVVDYILNPCMADELIMRASFLIDKARVAEFDRVLDGLDAAKGGRLHFRYIGPLPPYSFAGMRVR